MYQIYASLNNAGYHVDATTALTNPMVYNNRREQGENDREEPKRVEEKRREKKKTTTQEF